MIVAHEIFMTPSTMLADLGFDPLPYYSEGPCTSDECPYAVFTGVGEDPFLQIGQSNIDVFRDGCLSQKLFLHPEHAGTEKVKEGEIRQEGIA